ncbi:SprT-like domain-containing protein [Marinilongibacter aquaticus]|uniref:SprT-like domain-containing protein n=1 Tax=Marinilongibacter aquaticus TaxID=2975157 RepID=UPI0021BD3C15|nr:SprT-like domain-containing protein [Marinilongibacter aquaticus]UBM57921.1 SprT-like domain-containing protein [Marinilongibacter aquaticus]
MSKVKLNSALLRQNIAARVPEMALDYCVALWEEHPFSFTISKSRSSCLGNYKFEQGMHTISVNHDLNRFSFLITYLHEVAHLRVCLAFPPNTRKKVKPHGLEWKTYFRKLMTPLLNETVFPPSVLGPLLKHMKNPPASSTRDAQLIQALRLFDSGKTFSFRLEDLEDGQRFLFKKRIFKRLEKRRTRALCQEVSTGLKYTIPLLAEVLPKQ